MRFVIVAGLSESGVWAFAPNARTSQGRRHFLMLFVRNRDRRDTGFGESGDFHSLRDQRGYIGRSTRRRLSSERGRLSLGTGISSGENASRSVIMRSIRSNN